METGIVSGNFALAPLPATLRPRLWQLLGAGRTASIDAPLFLVSGKHGQNALVADGPLHLEGPLLWAALPADTAEDARGRLRATVEAENLRRRNQVPFHLRVWFAFSLLCGWVVGGAMGAFEEDVSWGAFSAVTLIMMAIFGGGTLRGARPETLTGLATRKQSVQIAFPGAEPTSDGSGWTPGLGGDDGDGGD